MSWIVIIGRLLEQLPSLIHVGFVALKKEDSPSDSPFFAAIRDGDLSEVARQTQQNKTLTTTPFSNGWTPLYLAARENRTEVLSFLLQCGASVHERSNGAQPIHITCMHGHMEAFSLLRTHEANIHYCLEVSFFSKILFSDYLFCISYLYFHTGGWKVLSLSCSAKESL